MDAGYLDEFDVKKYVKKRLLEIKDEDEYALAKSVLYDGLYKMSEVFEERFKSYVFGFSKTIISLFKFLLKNTFFIKNKLTNTIKMTKPKCSLALGKIPLRFLI